MRGALEKKNNGVWLNLNRDKTNSIEVKLM